MHVKELELAGFKSFVDPIRLSFKPGITALVGPNGCGKSNIMDAMRWIMGEHNARSLRGTKMEDLIFNGSDTRKPMGMAEVSMILTRSGNGNGNGNGSASGELMVTRRLYRSGDSEYFINKIPCRLKDIVELFLDSGIGSKSYSIMEQGKVDYILSLKPDERRMLIEEAAGISKYRSRKKEALSKMQSTRTNLDRLKDILSEIQLQMRALDLQVKRLKRYRTIKEEIRHIDLQLAARRLHTLQSDRHALERVLAACRDDEIRIATEKNSLEALLEQNRLQLADLRREAGQLQQNLYDCKSRVHQFESSTRTSEQELHNTRSQIDKCNLELEELGSVLASIDTDMCAGSRERDALQAELHALETRFSASSAALEQSKDALGQLQATIASENARLLNTTYEKTETKNAVLLNSRLQEELTVKRQKLTAEQQHSQDRQAELSGMRSHHEHLIAGTVAARAEKQAEGEALRSSMERLSRALNEETGRLNDCRDTRGSVRARLQSLQDLQKGFEGYDEGVRTLMNTDLSSADAPGGIVGLLADGIETDPQYEPAVSAALGRKLQSVVVDSHRDCLHAVAFLQGRGAGRVSLIPRSLPDHSSPEPAGDAGRRLLQLLSVGETCRAIATLLLEDVYLADTLEEAIELWRATPYCRTFVTPSGEVVDSCGLVTGGTHDDSNTGILRRNREIRQHIDELAGLEKTFERLSDGCRRMQEELARSGGAYETVAASVRALDLALVQERSRLEQVEREIRQESDRASLLAAEYADTSSALDAHARHLDELQRKLTDLTREEERLSVVVRDFQIQESQMRRSLEATESDHTEIRISLASARQKLDHINGTLQRLNEQKARTASKIDSIAGERESLRNRIGTLESAIDEARSRLDEAVKNSMRLEAALAEQQQQVQDLEAATLRSEELLKELRAGWERIEPRIHDTQLNISTIVVHLEHLAKELAEKYSLGVHELPAAPEQDAFSEDERLAHLETLKKRLENIGEVNLGAAREYEELEKRMQFLSAQEQDLLKAIDSLQKVIAKINRVTRQKFSETYEEINGHFKQLFPLLFDGGNAYMQLTNEQDILETGIEIFAQPPGKKLQSLDLLSGGERALTVIALMFAIFLTKPSPFCLMDEIDAPLDDANIGRFIEHLHTMAARSQFIIVTHNKLSMEAADSLYGVTMEEHGVSKVVSVLLN